MGIIPIYGTTAHPVNLLTGRALARLYIGNIPTRQIIDGSLRQSQQTKTVDIMTTYNQALASLQTDMDAAIVDARNGEKSFGKVARDTRTLLTATTSGQRLRKDMQTFLNARFDPAKCTQTDSDGKKSVNYLGKLYNNWRKEMSRAMDAQTGDTRYAVSFDTIGDKDARTRQVTVTESTTAQRNAVAEHDDSIATETVKADEKLQDKLTNIDKARVAALSPREIAVIIRDGLDTAYPDSDRVAVVNELLSMFKTQKVA